MLDRMYVWLRALLVAAPIAVIATVVLAQDKFPSRPIEMIIPIAAGGGTDVTFRLLAELVEPILGQRVVIVNQPGGSGVIGTSTLVRAAPDGYTVEGLWNAPLTIVPQMTDVPYKPSDYSTVFLATKAPTVLCTKPEFPAANGEEFIEEIRKNPDKYTYGNDGVGGIVHLQVERIFAELGVKARMVPLGGAADTLKSFLGGFIDIYGGAIPTILPYVQDGTAKCLLLIGLDKMALVPDASTLTDLGIPQAEVVFWLGMIAPKDVPADRLTVLEEAFRQAAQTKQFKEFAEKRGLIVQAGSSADLRALINAQYEEIGGLITTLGLKQQ